MNGRTAEVASVGKDNVAFRLEDGRTPELDRKEPQLCHIDHAWASTVHAFQGRTVDNVIAIMEANHPHLTEKELLRRDQPCPTSGGTGHRRR